MMTYSDHTLCSLLSNKRNTKSNIMKYCAEANFPPLLFEMQWSFDGSVLPKIYV